MRAFSGKMSMRCIHSYRAIAAVLLLCGWLRADAESDAVLALLSPADAEFTAVQDGNWSDPATWDHGVPTGGDVLLPQGMSVTLDVDTPVLRSLRVDGAFDATDSRDTTLRVDTVVVSHMGNWTVCLDEAAVTHRVVFVDDPTLSDPRQLSLGFVAMGHVGLNGQQKSEACLMQPASTGDNALSLLVLPSGWQVGDTVVIAGARYGKDEQRKIAALDGQTLRLDAPLEFGHVPPDPTLPIHVANYTRNIVFESAAPATIAPRGHCMFMHNPDQRISGVGFYNLGRTDKSRVLNSATLDGSGNLVAGTNQVGRYSLHIHRAGVQAGVGTVYVGYCAIFNDSTFSFTPGWGLAHHSSKALVEHTASFNVFGAHFATEAGNECGEWRSNVAIRTSGSLALGSFQGIGNGRIDSHADHAHEGHGFWLTGGGVSIHDCVAAGCRFGGTTVMGRGLRENGVDTTFLKVNLRVPYNDNSDLPYVQVRNVPILVERQLSYACGHGFHAWNVAAKGTRSVVSNMKAWNCFRDAYFSSYTSEIDVIDPVLVNAPGVSLPPTDSPAADANGGVSSAGATSNAGGGDVVYYSPTIRGFGTGLNIPLSKGLKVTVHGGVFDNKINIRVLRRLTSFSDRIAIIDGNPQFAPGADFHVFLEDDWQQPLPRSFDAAVFRPDTLTFNGQRLYWQVQKPGFVPYPTRLPANVPAEYVGLTNTQLRAQFGISVFGEIFDGPILPGTNGMVAAPPPPQPETCEEKLAAALNRIMELEGR